MRLADVQFRRILDKKDAVVFRDRIREHIEQRRFPLPVPPAINMFCPSSTASVSDGCLVVGQHLASIRSFRVKFRDVNLRIVTTAGD